MSDESSEVAKVTRPVHLAAKSGTPKIITLLAEAGANLDAQNEQKQSALHIATAHSQLSVSSNAFFCLIFSHLVRMIS